MIDILLLAINITLMFSAPLILAALGGVISEKAGVINIGLEGIMTIGAFAAATVAFYTGNPWLGLLASAIAGSILSAIHGIASISFKADQTISGIALNFIGPGVAMFLCRIFFGTAQTPSVPNRLPSIFSWMDNISSSRLMKLNFEVSVLIAFALAFIMWFVLYKTKWGLRIRAVGEHPAAADTLGVSVIGVRYAAVILSGVLAGFGGAARSIAVVSSFTPTTISGHGFIALAAVIFGKWTPQGAVLACLLFGFSQSLVVLLGGTDINISPQILSMLPYVLTLVVLVLFVGKSVAPKANGTAYEKGKR